MVLEAVNNIALQGQGVMVVEVMVLTQQLVCLELQIQVVVVAVQNICIQQVQVAQA